MTVDEWVGYPLWANHPRMSLTRTARRPSPIASIKASTVRAAADRRAALSFEKSRSMCQP
jgi:hypothetical protein